MGINCFLLFCSVYADIVKVHLLFMLLQTEWQCYCVLCFDIESAYVSLRPEFNLNCQKRLLDRIQIDYGLRQKFKMKLQIERAVTDFCRCVFIFCVTSTHQPFCIMCPWFIPIINCHTMLCQRGLSSCGIRPSRSWILSKRVNICSKLFHHRVATPFQFFHTKRRGNIPTGTPLTGALNAGGVGRNRNSEPISGFVACCQRCNWLGG